MSVLVDTPIWALALRRTAGDLNPEQLHLRSALEELIREGRAQLIGPVRQELLSGIRQEAIFKKVRDSLRAFDEPGFEVADYEEAAQISNRCRSRGIAGSAVDFFLCAIALRRRWKIFTTDQDFTHYARVVSLKLYKAI